MLSNLLVVCGVLALAWTVVVWRWQDPFTAIETTIAQRHLRADYARRVTAYRPARPLRRESKSVVLRALRVDALSYARSLQRGGPVGRLKIGRIGLNMIVVQGTDEDTLKKGPAHQIATALPGEGSLIYVAGHRTTYLAPFSHIEEIRMGDYITFSLPYGTFTYRVFRHYVVAANDLKVLVNHGREVLRLQACHPRFFATHRYIVDARLVSVEGLGAGRPIALAASG
jgi:sortase A